MFIENGFMCLGIGWALVLLAVPVAIYYNVSFKAELMLIELDTELMLCWK